MPVKFQYPRAREDETKVEDYHGTKIADPYNWMEDPDNEETKNFVEEQNKVSMPYLNKCRGREQFHERMTELYNYPKYSCPFKRGNRYFFFKNSGLQNQSVLYTQDTLDSEPYVFLDPNELSEDGTLALRGMSFSYDGSHFAYGLSQSGSDWVSIKIKKVDGSLDLPDELKRVKFSCMSWTHDNKGLFYNMYLEQDGKTDGTETTSNINQKLFYHVLGTDQSKDVLCAEFLDEPQWMSGASVSDDGNYALLYVSRGCDPVNQLWYVDLRQSDLTKPLNWNKLIDNFDAEYSYITNDGSLFTFKTNLNAPRYKIIQIDFDRPEKSNWTTLLPEHEKDVLEDVSCVYNDKLIVEYLSDVKSVLELRELSSGELVLTFPLDVGSVEGLTGRKEQSEIFYKFASFLTPGVIFHCDLSKSEILPTIFREIEVKGFNAHLFETSQVFYESKDGTKVPMFIVHKKGLEMDGSHPTLLYGYGGFKISITPGYSVSRVIFMQHLGGVVAVANIRGGGEYGETWHKAGMLANKQNCFDDFQSAAEFLINEKYTSPNKLTINGGSNGGLLVAACLNQRPDLFGCGIAQVGVMDMLKFHRYTIGHAWTTDYGNPDNSEDFKWLFNMNQFTELKLVKVGILRDKVSVKWRQHSAINANLTRTSISPLHNVSVNPTHQYPSLLLLTGDHDDRVVPHHSLKLVATLQRIHGCLETQTNPILVRVDTKSGHGAGKPTSKIIDEVADIYAFIAESVGAKWRE